jgi:hypothetical protein
VCLPLPGSYKPGVNENELTAWILNPQFTLNRTLLQNSSIGTRFGTRSGLNVAQTFSKLVVTAELKNHERGQK